MLLNFPPKSVFSEEMPRYPNVWVSIAKDIITNKTQAISFLKKSFKSTCRLKNFPDSIHVSSEGCDAQVRVGSLQPYSGFSDEDLNHRHQLHVRYYYSTCYNVNLTSKSNPSKATNGSSFIFPASVHYEVELEDPNHATVVNCPVCGKGGKYSEAKDIVKDVHDPLGLELIINGTIRDDSVVTSNGQPIEGITKLENYKVESIVFTPSRKDINTAQIGVVRIKNRDKSAESNDDK